MSHSMNQSTSHNMSQQYTFNFSTADQNKQRVAEVWLDEYKKYFYEFAPSRSLKPLYDLELSQRLVLKRRLKCEPFSWFMREVYPELTIPKQLSNDNCLGANVGAKVEEVIAHAPKCDPDELSKSSRYLFFSHEKAVSKLEIFFCETLENF